MKPTLTTTDDANSSELVFTRITNTRGPLTKTFEVNPDDPNGNPVTATSAQLYEGIAETVRCVDLYEFAELLPTLRHDQALAFGVTNHESVDLVTKSRLHERPGAIARDREHFQYRSAPGLWMNDHDAGYLPVRYDSAEDIRAAIRLARPALAGMPMVWAASASSYIVNEETGQVVKGPGGSRIYFPVTDVSDVPRATKALRDYLWAAGIGAYSVSRAGRLIERTLFDLMTAQPERLDFVAGAKCVAPLVQRRPEAIVFDCELVGGVDPINLKAMVPDPPSHIREAAEAHRCEARLRAEPERQRVRAAYVAERVKELVERGVSERVAADTVEQALNNEQLLADFLLYPESGGTVTVGEVLADPKKWHGARFADPLEPGYGNDNRIARANLRGGGRPYIHSHAHGGMRYVLFSQPTVLQVQGGDAPRLADACIDLLKIQGQVYDLPSDGMARVGADGRQYQVSIPWLQDHLGRIVSFQRFDARAKVYRPINVPQPVANAVFAREGQRGLPMLNAVVTAPTMRADGSVLDVPGYDRASGLLFVSDTIDVPKVPLSPKKDQVMVALRAVWGPISQFPYDGPTSQAVALAAILTSCVRRGLPTAPGFALDAPAAGTGKTLLARCIAAIGGHTTETTPLPGPEEERRKLLFSLLLGGVGCITLDNVSGVLGGAAFDQFMTASEYSDRVLGESRTAKVPNRALLLATGNNIVTLGDTNRRILRTRIDAKVERPYSRSFAFNPAQMIAAHRMKLTAAALTIIRGYLVADPRRGSLASFEEWDHLVRNAVLWLGRVQDEIALADPVATIDDAEDADDTKGATLRFMQAWHCVLGDRPVTSADVIEASREPSDFGAMDVDNGAAARTELRSSMRSAIRSDSHKLGEIDARELSTWLRAKKDGIAGGLRIEASARNRLNTAQWRVVPAMATSLA